MDLTEQQKSAHDKIMDWLKTDQQYISLSGYAGTGKTTLLGELASSIQSNFPSYYIYFVTYTGKASTVLSQKLFGSGINWDKATCTTIHSLMYNYMGTDKKTKKMLWSKKPEEEITGDLIVIDEASMVTDEIFSDLLQLNKKVLFVGDPGQLPPVNGKPFEPLLTTDIKLTEIHRQAWDNPITRIATQVRRGEEVPFGIYDNCVARLRKTDKKSQQILMNFYKSIPTDIEKVILCRYNKSRVNKNQSVRQVAGFPNKPVPGDRVICLQNNKSVGLMNGSIVHIHDVSDVNKWLYKLEFMNYGHFYAPAESFNNDNPNGKGEITTGTYVDKSLLLYFDYAYAITTHKAQGSEWDKVIVYNEKPNQVSNEEHAQWLYTAITRAKEKLLLVG